MANDKSFEEIRKAVSAVLPQMDRAPLGTWPDMAQALLDKVSDLQEELRENEGLLKVLRRHRDEAEAKAERYAEALGKIADCTPNAPGDVVHVARQALSR